MITAPDLSFLCACPRSAVEGGELVFIDKWNEFCDRRKLLQLYSKTKKLKKLKKIREEQVKSTVNSALLLPTKLSGIEGFAFSSWETTMTY